MDSKIGLIIQLAGVLLITLLTLFLRRSLNVAALRHWTNSWLFLSCALFCMRLAFSFDGYSSQLFSFYFLTQYLFGMELVAGCRSLIDDTKVTLKKELVIVPFIIIAFALPFLSEDLTLILNIHSLILAGYFGMAFVSVWRVKIKSFGRNVMLVALALLVVDLAQSFVAFGLKTNLDVSIEYLAFNPVVDLVLQILLGFGMVIVLLEQILADAKVANEKLQLAHERLEELAHIDPLTTALNRRAFHGYVRQAEQMGRDVSGCVGFFDIDNLKELNDIHGHVVGDSAIRAVVRSIRDIIRGEDLIFRWGGDEFFVVMIGLDCHAAQKRISRMHDLLAEVWLEGMRHPVTIGVSHAFESFEKFEDLELAIEQADAKMYLEKQRRKSVYHEPANRFRADDHVYEIVVT